MLLRDAIDIPTEVHASDLVFILSDAAGQAEQTVRQYVVTEKLLSAFLDAERLVRSAVTGGASKGAFLHGSFGSGKSNFMGVLQLLLDGHPAALAKAELAPVVAQLNEWRDDQTFLTVPFHLIGATSLESAVFGQYVDYVGRLHPDAPMPGVFADEPLLANADELRSTMGDETFFAALGGPGGADWGKLSGWNAERYERARHQPVGSDERRLLVQALLDGLLSGFADAAKANRGGYVDMESGLAALSRHAHDLGYAGLILFLDELILWLMSRMGDAAFVSAEASKISKFVEASEASRPTPIISIIARQRDLRDLIGQDVPGAERLGFVDQLTFQEDRFKTIKLDDSNLPVVAHHRLLEPSSDAGRDALADAFASLSLTDDQRDALLGSAGTDADFALCYPFSPAFLTIVVDLAGALQRTRTGLKVLLQLLVDRRDTLAVGQLVPVGDLFDVFDTAGEPLSDAMRPRFEAAQRVYRRSLLPMLRAQHGLNEGDELTPAFVNDSRILATLLLAALVPNSEPFRDLTARKLVALNHGLISSPVPGMEVAAVVTKLRGWAASTGEIQVGDDPYDPTVHLALSEVDTRSILDSVTAVDNPGRRRGLVRQILAEELGVATDELLQSTTLEWRGVTRTVELVFGNIRDADSLSDSAFSATGNWKVVIDFPFDEEGHTPLEDLERVQQLQVAGNAWRTVCWIPSFFTAEMRSQLGDLVRLDHLLPVPGQTSERFLEATRHLSPDARESARPRMEQQQSAARARLRTAIRQAYGVGTADPAMIDAGLNPSDHYPTLLNGFEVRPPVASDLRDAFDQVVCQALEHTYPAAPRIEGGEVRTAELRRVLQICTDALEQPDRRIASVPSADRRTMRRIANELNLGVQSEQAFLLDVTPRWDGHFTRKLADRERSGAEGPVTVGELRAWIDEPQAMGLSEPLADLVILVWAAATDRTFTDHGGPARTDIGALGDHLEVVAEELPAPDVWNVARSRAEKVFGVAQLPATPSAVGLAKLSAGLSSNVMAHRDEAAELVNGLESVAALVDGSDAQRVRTARTASRLLNALGAAAKNMERLDALVDADLSPSPEAIGASIKSAGPAAGTIRVVDLQIIAAALARSEGAGLRDELVALLDADELARPMAPALRELYQQARDLVIVEQPTPPVPDPAPVPPAPSSPTPSPDSSTISDSGLDRPSAVKRLKELRKQIESGDVAGERFDITITAYDSLTTHDAVTTNDAVGGPSDGA